MFHDRILFKIPLVSLHLNFFSLVHILLNYLFLVPGMDLKRQEALLRGRVKGSPEEKPLPGLRTVLGRVTVTVKKPPDRWQGRG